MNKRIFFFGDINFPRGNAAANYVQYMAHALIREEWKVIVVGTNKVKKDLSQPIRGIADGIEYITFSFTGKFRQFEKKDLDYVTSLFAVDKEDYAIIYGTNLFLSN